MKKALFIMSVSVTILCYSLGLTIFGTYGIINMRTLAAREGSLRSTHALLYSEHDQLLKEKELFDDEQYITELAARYGYISDQTIIYLPEHAAGEPLSPLSPLPQELYLRDEHAEPIIGIPLLLGLSLLAGLLAYLLLGLLFTGKDTPAADDDQSEQRR